jgi:N4-gp56 family major capsid protein
VTTSVGYGADANLIEQAAGLFIQHMRRDGKMSKLRGKMPKESEAVSGERMQTSASMPIVQTIDLGKGIGDEVEFNFLQPIGAYPIMGSNIAQGRGSSLHIIKERMRVNQARFPIDTGDAMSRIRSPVDLVRFARPAALELMNRYVDDSTLVHMAGARGFHNTLEWGVPLASHPDFASIMVNPVTAPTKNRHFVVDGDAIIGVTANGGDLTTTTGSVMDIGVMDAIRNVMDNMSLPPPPVVIEGDVAAKDEPLRLMLMGPSVYNKFAADSAYRSYQAAAMSRARTAKEHPLFLGEVALWNGFLIMKTPKAIRFYAGDEIKYCASLTSETESSVLVPASFGTTYAVERSLILGGQGVAEAMARHPDYNGPIFWGTEEYDFKDKKELMIGAVRALRKVRWKINTGAGEHWTDHGIIAIDSVVPITGARN